MKLGYPAINWGLAEGGVRSHGSFMLKSYSPERFRAAVAANLDGLGRILAWNVERGLFAFRISSDLIPFASHPVQTVDWVREFALPLRALGEYVRGHDIRITMHPGQYTLINSPNEATHARSVLDLTYHAEVLDAMGLDASHKVQIHVGGLYGDKAASMDRFACTYAELPEAVRRRLVIENDDRLFGLDDCLELSGRVGVPVLLDTFHLSVKEPETDVRGAVKLAAATWGEADGVLMVDYSSQQAGKRPGAHAETLDEHDFAAFLSVIGGTPADVILEIKDKEASALRAVRLVPGA